MNAGQAGAGFLCVGGGFWKAYSSSEQVLHFVSGVLHRHEWLLRRLKTMKEKYSNTYDNLIWGFESLVWFATYLFDNLDMMMPVLAGLYFFWGLFSAPGNSSWQLGRFREEEEERDRAQQEMQQKNHREMMDQLRQMQGGSSSSSGGNGAALSGSIQDQLGQAGQDAGGGGLTGLMRRGATGVAEQMRRLMRRARNPLQAALRVLEQFKEQADWAMPPGFTKRLAKDYTADVYSNNTTARTRMLGFFREHGGLDKCNAARPLLAIADLMDAFVIEDGAERVPQLINSEGYERLCRWGYALEHVFGEVTREEEWKDSKKATTRWALLKRYHPTEGGSGVVSEEADQEVQEGMKRDALFQKYLSQVTTEGP